MSSSRPNCSPSRRSSSGACGGDAVDLEHVGEDRAAAVGLEVEERVADPERDLVAQLGRAQRVAADEDRGHQASLPIERAQHVLQDPAVAEVVAPPWGCRCARAPRTPCRRRCTVTSRGSSPAFSGSARPVIVNSSSPVRPSDSARLAVGELQRQHAHADEVGAVDALEGLGDHRAHAEQVRALGRPVARRARAVLLAAEDDERRALLGVAASRRRRSTSPRRPAGAASRRPRCPARAGCAGGCWRTCRASSPRGCRAASRRS